MPSGGKRHKPLIMKDLNLFLTKFCDDRDHHDYSNCLQWHSNISKQIPVADVKKKHLRRIPIEVVAGQTRFLYLGEKCPYPDNCPDGALCSKCHNDREYMYHPLVYMTVQCNKGALCRNRFCAFYHTKLEQEEQDSRRDAILKEIANGRPATKPPSRPLVEESPLVAATQNLKISIKKPLKSAAPAAPPTPTSASGSVLTPQPKKSPIAPVSVSPRQSETKGSEVVYTNQHVGEIDLAANPRAPPSRVSEERAGASARYSNHISPSLEIQRDRPVSSRLIGNTFAGVFTEFGVRWPVLVRELDTSMLGNIPEHYEMVTKPISHPNFVCLRSAQLVGDRTYLVMDHPGIPRHQFLQSPPSNLKDILPSLATQLCHAVAHLHQTGHPFLLDIAVGLPSPLPSPLILTRSVAR